MPTDINTLRELTIRYAVKADVAGQPSLIGRTLNTPHAVAAALTALLLHDESTEVFTILCLSAKLPAIRGVRGDVVRDSAGVWTVSPDTDPTQAPSVSDFPANAAKVPGIAVGCRSGLRGGSDPL